MAEQRPMFRFRLPWLQAAPAPAPRSTPASRSSAQPNTNTSPTATTRPTTRSQTSSQPSTNNTEATTSRPPSRPKTEATTRNQPTSTSATTTQTSKKPSSPRQPSSGNQASSDAPTTTITPPPKSPTPVPRPSADTNSPIQPSTTSPSPPAESNTPTQSSTTNSTTTNAPADSNTPIQPSKTNSTPTNAPAETNTPILPSTTSTSPVAATPTLPLQPSADPSTTNTTPSNAPAHSTSETQNPATVITNTTSAPTIAQRPPFRPPGVAPSQSPPSQTRATKIESHPLKPIQEQPLATSQPASPSVAATKSPISQPPSPSKSPSRSAPQSQNPPSQTRTSKTESKPSTPSQEQPPITSQPASPSVAGSKSRLSQPPSSSPIPSPSRSAPQLRGLTPTSSPKASRPASQTSSSIPSSTTSQMQPKDQTTTQPTSPPKQLQGSSEPSSKSTETLSSIAEGIQPQSERMKLQVKKESRSEAKSMQPSELSEGKSTEGITEGPSQIPDSSGIAGEPKTLGNSDTSIHETKEVKEVVQDTMGKDYVSEEEIDDFLTTKEEPNIVFQSNGAHTEKHEGSNGKQARKITSPLKYQTVATPSNQKTTVSDEQTIPLHKDIKENISKFVHKMTTGDGKQDKEERPVNVITLAGDNRGASMQLGSDESRKQEAIHIRRGYKLNPDESGDATTDAEGSSKGSKRPKQAKIIEDQAIEAYINCNVQGLNNSIMFDSSITERNPGVNMSIPQTKSESAKPSESKEPFEARKAEVNVTPAQKLTYEPIIRRRCLRGLFLEPSDSDPDNPDKPRRHGCRVGCTEKKSKCDNDINIL